MKCRISLLFMVSLGLVMTQALPAAEPVVKVPEKKIAIPEEPILKKADITETIPAIAVEGAEEPKKADRAKKSASTTFCVEIRPGSSEVPAKVFENPPPPPQKPQVPQEAHEVHEHPPPPPPAHIQEPQNPVFIIPPNPSEILIPNEPYPPQVSEQSYLHFPYIFHPPPPPPPQQVFIPSVVSNPCPSVPQQTFVIPGSVPNPYPPQPSAPQQTFVIPGSVPSPYPPQPSAPQQTFGIPGSVPNPYPPQPSAPQQTIVIPGSVPSPYPPQPSAPQQTFVIPGSVPSPYPPQPSAPQQTMIFPGFPHPYPQYPCPPSPCATSGPGIQPHAMRAFIRPVMGPMNALSLHNGMEMRSSNDQANMEFVKETSSMNSSDGMAAKMKSEDAMVSKMDPNQEVETVGTSISKLHAKKPVAQKPSLYPLYPSTAINERTSYVIRCNPQVLALANGGSAYVIAAGRGRSSETNLMDSNVQSMMVADGPLAMGMPQQARHHVIEPYISGGGYSSHSVIPSVVQHTTYQSIPSSVDSYPVRQHSVIPGYSVHHRKPSVILPGISIHSHPGVITPGHSSGIYRMGNDQQRYQQAQKKSWKSEAEQRASMDQQMSLPSGSFKYFKGPTPRISEEKSNDPYDTAKITIPQRSQSWVTMDEKNNDKNDDVTSHENMAKRKTDKTATENKN